MWTGYATPWLEEWGSTMNVPVDDPLLQYFTTGYDYPPDPAHLMPYYDLGDEQHRAYALTSQKDPQTFSAVMKTVNYMENVIDPESSVRTQNIESNWRVGKDTMPGNGTRTPLFEGYLYNWTIRGALTFALNENKDNTDGIGPEELKAERHTKVATCPSTIQKEGPIDTEQMCRGVKH
ncbi:hypothetical protein DFS34DRAFT_656971 [Phlyctochytrium arcticum]|nr:hypothetical protein DFS34DRAFT_656971 [Phlyctochytrium arcticum]